MNQQQMPPYWNQEGTTHSTYPQEFMDHYQKPLKPWHGILFFAAVMVMMLFVAAPIQYFLGMWGLALTELLLLGMALGFALLTRRELRLVFPLRKPTWKETGGTLLTWLGSYLLVMLSTMILMYFFPQGFTDVSNSMNSVFSSTPLFVTFFIVAVLPPICEEAVHRGVIQYTFGNVRSTPVVVLSIGLIFGIFHLDPYRFLPTALLGMGLAYVMQKTRNMLYPALFHFINNALSVLASSSTDAASEISADLLTGPLLLISVGAYLIIASVAPFCLLGGVCLLRRPWEPKRRLLIPVLLIALLTGLMIISGFALILFTFLKNPDLSTVTQDLENLLAAWIIR
ncbi:MAG: CPBP family intramembrane metalloprotease [Lachnospiraceae bacterium]|jgi:membrane protease YdiL (CAAX protease family)|nr:CPBP family intramembrane metalloprotease [Lachnospiraceae bacterium]MCI8996430.1 CPBP family intramembrane metalloprotease [Lachnospiraceae bacterium]MCI9134036.1 CPBP family intramembrane metalloprotease [Lachnospiraceae bacterium]